MQNKLNKKILIFLTFTTLIAFSLLVVMVFYSLPEADKKAVDNFDYSTAKCMPYDYSQARCIP